MDRVLVIDDMQSNVELMVIYLREAGYDVITANDGAAGIKRAETFKPDVIVLDLVMPKISGFDVCRTLKRNDATKNMMILAITAVPTKDSRVRAFEAGADEYMEKSFDKGMFLAKIKALFRVKVLSDKLKENYAVMEEQTKQFEFQLEMARHIQQALISEMTFSFKNISFASCYNPAQSVGGDFYDVVTSSSSVAIFIADVSGHGVSAALLTSMLKIMFRNHGDLHKNPEKLLHTMNEEFCDIFDDSSVMIYASAFFAYIDIKENQVSYSSAGASPPVFLDFSKKTAAELQLAGKPLGMMKESIYVSKTEPFEEGDMIFFHTDGLCDAFFKDEPEMFVKKLCEILVDYADNKPEEIIEYALEEFYNCEDGVKVQNDDVSIIVCKAERK